MGFLKFSFSLGLVEPSLLENLLSKKVRDGIFSDYISFAYIQNPFLLIRDDENFCAKGKHISQLVSVLTKHKVEPIFSLEYRCFGDHHLTLDFQKRLGSVLKKAQEVGIDKVSVGDLYIAKMLTTPLPPYNSFNPKEVFISFEAKIDRAIKLTYLENISFSFLTLHPDVLKHEGEINEIVKAYSPEKIEVVLNSGCIYRCPFEIFCKALMFHIHQEMGGNFKDNFYYKKCCKWLEEEPSLIGEILAVHPKFLKKYANLGIKHFRILNDPQDVEDIYRKVLPYIERLSHPSFSMVYLREYIKGEFYG